MGHSMRDSKLTAVAIFAAAFLWGCSSQHKSGDHSSPARPTTKNAPVLGQKAQRQALIDQADQDVFDRSVDIQNSSIDAMNALFEIYSIKMEDGHQISASKLLKEADQSLNEALGYRKSICHVPDTTDAQEAFFNGSCDIGRADLNEKMLKSDRSLALTAAKIDWIKAKNFSSSADRAFAQGQYELSEQLRAFAVGNLNFAMLFRARGCHQSLAQVQSGDVFHPC
jgi:hypothetical protein